MLNFPYYELRKYAEILSTLSAGALELLASSAGGGVMKNKSKLEEWENWSKN